MLVEYHPSISVVGVNLVTTAHMVLVHKGMVVLVGDMVGDMVVDTVVGMVVDTVVVDMVADTGMVVDTMLTVMEESEEGTDTTTCPMVATVVTDTVQLLVDMVADTDISVADTEEEEVTRMDMVDTVVVTDTAVVEDMDQGDHTEVATDTIKHYTTPLRPLMFCWNILK